MSKVLLLLLGSIKLPVCNVPSWHYGSCLQLDKPKACLRVSSSQFEFVLQPNEFNSFRLSRLIASELDPCLKELSSSSNRLKKLLQRSIYSLTNQGQDLDILANQSKSLLIANTSRP